MIVFEDFPNISLNKQGQPRLKLAGDLTAILSMAIGHREKVAILKTKEVRHCDPGILVCLVRIRGRLACLRCESEFCNAIGIHLLWISSVKAVRKIDHRTL